MTKEEVLEAANVMIAYTKGKRIGIRPIRSTEPLLRILDVPTWNWEQKEYRVIPDPSYRAWTADEVPLGAWLRSKENGWRALIFEVRRDGQMEINNSSITPYSALRYCEHSTDGGKTWLPCGVEEESK